jgi:hypothetical protein
MKIPFDPYDFFGYLATGFLVLYAFDYAFHPTPLTDQELKAGPAVLYILLAYILGQIIASPSSYFLEHLIVGKGLGPPEVTLFEAANAVGKRWRKWSFPGYYEALPTAMQAKVRAAAQADGFDEVDRGLFLYAHAVAKHDQTTFGRLSMFLNQYGFCRNISMGMLVAAVILFAGAILHIGHRTSLDDHRLAWAIGALLGAVGMFYRYLKFFRLYTAEVFISYAAQREVPPAQAGQ